MNKGKKILVLVIKGMQGNYVNGAAENEMETVVLRKVLHRVINKLRYHYNKYDTIYILRGKSPSPCCLKNGTDKDIWIEFWDIVDKLREKKKFVEIVNNCMVTSTQLINHLSVTCGHNDEIEFCGAFTDSHIVSNAICLRAELPHNVIKIDNNCCAGTTIKAHNAALHIMTNCCIDIINRFHDRRTQAKNNMKNTNEQEGQNRCTEKINDAN